MGKELSSVSMNINKINTLIYLILLASQITFAFADEKLSQIQNEIFKLKSAIVDSEKQINFKSQEYNQVSQELKSYEDRLRLIELTLHEYKQKIRLDYQQLQRSWNILLMQQADDQRHAEYLVTHKLIINQMKNKSERLKKNIVWATNLESSLNMALKKTNEVRIKSDLLLSLIQRLEDEKIGLLSKINERRSFGEKVENTLINKKLELQVARGDYLFNKNFILPLSKYDRYESTENGINFICKNNAVLLAPSHGKVIYVGELASYGNVIMIEHDQKMISVMLGDIQIDVNESTIVTQGSIVGQLLVNKDAGSKTLYYEIRKEEKPVPTLSYLKVKN